MRSKLVLVISLLHLLSYAQYEDDSYTKPYSLEDYYVDYLDVDTSFKEDYKDDAYDYSPIASEEEEKKQEEPEVEETRSSKSSFKFNFGGLAKVIFYVILIALAIFIVYVISQAVTGIDFKKKRSKKTVKSSETEEAIVPEDTLDQHDLKARISRAKDDQNYSLAIRLYFLLYLERLEKSNVINYHRDKTNQDYLADLKSDQQVTQFAKLAYPFEHIWYGKKPINESLFLELEELYRKEINAIK